MLAERDKALERVIDIFLQRGRMPQNLPAAANMVTKVTPHGEFHYW